MELKLYQFWGRNLSVRFSKVVYTPPGGEKGVFRGGGRGYGLYSLIGLKIYLLEAIFPA